MKTTSTIMSTREAFIKAFWELNTNSDRFALVSADSLAAMRATEFAKAYPERVYEAGIAEQNAVALAAGLATTGLIPFVCTYAGFLTMRACEQIRTFVAYPNLNVKLVGLNGGMYGGEKEGVTHQCYEDFAILRSIPNMTVFSACDAYETQAAVRIMASLKGPAYLRIGSGKEAPFYDKVPDLKVGELKKLTEYGTDAAIITTGFTVHNTMAAAEALNAQKIRTTVYLAPTIKPLDKLQVERILAETKTVVCVEDHSIYGGLGSAVTEIAGETLPRKIIRMGLDRFASSGSGETLLDEYGLSVSDIVQKVRESIVTNQ